MIARLGYGGSTEGDAGSLGEGGGEGVLEVVGCYVGGFGIDGEADGTCISGAVPDSRLGREFLGPPHVSAAQMRVAAINNLLYMKILIIRS